METHYKPSEIEQKWYPYWKNRGYFKSTPDDREPFTIVMPPPNVTGILHMGHMLNNTIQDILIRRARQEGKNACWVPGTDHASIATEAKVVQMLREKSINKRDIGREAFLQYAFEWKDKYGGLILDQLQRLGASADWDRTRFTMEDSLSRAVIKVFVDLYSKGKLYRAKRMTNWDPRAQTVLSNEEVIYNEEQGTLYYLQYPIAGNPKQSITIATVRPETILGDTAIAVHPDDERYKDLIGKMALVPLINREIPIIADTYVDREFGTGALKITPAHDPNDYEIGQRHQLDVIDILTPQGILSEEAQILVGEDRFAARKKIIPLLEEGGFLIKKEPYTHKVGRSERTQEIVEPRLTLQWFLKMDEFAAAASEAVRKGEVHFHPPHFENIYQSWLNPESIKDWCISRQLWWGQRIPAWYYQPTQGSDPLIFVAETAEEALEQARQKLGNPALTLQDLHQEEDVVDTWFSSWLWPISVFDGFDHQEDLNYYYPTQVLVTGWDIIFFWVARMIMAGYEWSPELLDKSTRQPFKDVYFTGMVRDRQRRKMSKSLGNSPDALKLLDRYGADGVRFGLLSSAAAGNDIVFDAPFDQATNTIINESQICDQGLRFCNKLWNALKLLKQLEIVDKPVSGEVAAINNYSCEWFEGRIARQKVALASALSQFRMSEALVDLYRFIWDDFCSWYLEAIKPEYGKPLDRETYDKTLNYFGELMVMLHPFMPFVTEEIWHQLKPREEGDDCFSQQMKNPENYGEGPLHSMEQVRNMVGRIREERAAKQIPNKDTLNAFLLRSSKSEQLATVPGAIPLVCKLGYLESLSPVDTEPEGCITLLADTEKIFLHFEQTLDVEAEEKKLKEEMAYLEGFKKSTLAKLSNERFVQNAPAQVVEMERKKLEDAETKIAAILQSLDHLRK